MTFQFGGGNVSLSVCAAAERVLCGFWAGLTTSNGGSISFLDGDAVMEVTAAAAG
jgi:hypothetical protein